MSKLSRLCAAVAATLGASGVAAQGACPAGPGAAFGITSLNCAGCAIKQDGSGRSSYAFFAEPVVLETAPNGPLAVGDIIEAVNGHPITTTAGADEFTHTFAGPNDVAIRRGRDRRVVSFTISADVAACGRPSRPREYLTIPEALQQIDSITKAGGLTDSLSRLRDNLKKLLEDLRREVPKGGMRVSSFGYFNGVGQPGKPLVIIDGSPVDMIPFAEFDRTPTGRFGFGVACTSTCAPASGMEGVTRFTYYRYSIPPPIIAIRPNGPAEHAGIKVGDVITKVDGISVLEDAGALRLRSLFPKDAIRITVIRDGKEAEYSIKLR